MASGHYWDQHNKELAEAMKKVMPDKQYHEITDKEERRVKRLASKIIKAGKGY